MATDYLVPSDFIGDLLSFHASHDASLSVSLKRVPEEELAMRSSVRFDERQYITEVVEKPAPGTAPSDLSANLAYVLPAQILKYLTTVKPSARGEREVQAQTAPKEWSPAGY